jgi:hypothetical protein
VRSSAKPAPIDGAENPNNQFMPAPSPRTDESTQSSAL